MSDQGIKSVDDANETSGQTAKSYQSAWMSHWMRTTTVAAGETRNQDASPKEELNSTSENDVSNKIILKSMGNERVEAVRPVVEDNLEKGKAVVSKNGIQYHSLGKGTSKKPPKWRKMHSRSKGRIIETQNPLHERNVESSSHTVPYSFNLEKKHKEKAAISPLSSRSAFVSKQLPNVRMLEREKWNEDSSSDDLFCESKVVNACFRESITCDHHLSVLKCSGIRLFPSQRIALDETDETKKSRIDHCHSLLRLQDCDRGGSEGNLKPGWCSRFSKTTHSLLLTKKTDVDQLKEKDVIESRVITKASGNKSNGLPRISPFLGQGKQRLKLHLLRSFTDSEAMENVEAFKDSEVTIMNESSAETDTMDFDFCKEKNLHSGSHSTASTKAFNMESNLPPSIGLISSSRESGPFIAELPNINLEPPERSLNNTFSFSSKTQSLEKLVAHDDQLNTKPNHWPDDCTSEDRGNDRWVKRLKLSCQNSSTDKSLVLEKSEYFCLEKDDGIIGGSENKGVGLLLSDAWIKRWLSNDSSRIVAKKKLPDQTVVINCEARNLKLISVDDSLKKMQFPSIAAMALMGKALTRFQPCELQKRGSFTIWKTKAF